MIEDAKTPGVMDSRPWWRRWLPEPFWWTLLALLSLALFGAVPFWIVGVLIWPDATGSTTLIFAAGYFLGIPFTWWLLRERRPTMTNIEYYADGEPVSIPSDMPVSAAANLAMKLLDRTGPPMILERESGASLNQQSEIGGACTPGERFKLVPAPPDDRRSD